MGEADTARGTNSAIETDEERIVGESVRVKADKD